MARLIVKSPYIKCGGNANVSGYLKYIATRERVEIIPDDRSQRAAQEPWNSWFSETIQTARKS